MSDLCYGCGQYVDQGCTCNMSSGTKELWESENLKLKLVTDNNALQKKLDRELKDNNGLREVIGIQRKCIDEIEKLFDNGNYSDIGFNDNFKTIIKEKSEAILKT